MIARATAPRSSRSTPRRLITLTAPSAHHPSFAPENLSHALDETLEDLALPPIARHTHRYAPQGASLVALSSELSLFLHTWPEHACATLDLHGAPTVTERCAAALCARLGWTWPR
ncbi:MAG: S-adenosylmethionine decarboxylase [Deltaproteobacteria bacterium]|nr:S-adenosylmethionine decarboxylase [Deltaproteobacteria bacterium]